MESMWGQKTKKLFYLNYTILKHDEHKQFILEELPADKYLPSTGANELIPKLQFRPIASQMVLLT